MMIAALMVLAFMWWSYWLLCRSMRSRGTPTVAAPKQHATRATTSLGLEDDPDQWRAGHGAWTALDDLQLTRLLVDSAPTTAAGSTDTQVLRIEQEDVL